MKANSAPREYGSEFHWVGCLEPDEHSSPGPWTDAGLLTGSGRDALRCLLRVGISEHGWRKVLVPSYFCQDVVHSILKTGLEVVTYLDDPGAPLEPPRIRASEVLLIVNTFGIRPRCNVPVASGSAVIEDHTHDPWAEWAHSSQATYCIASLRKTLPIADGGVVWSPASQPLPLQPELTSHHHVAAAKKLEAMLLKEFYLRGRPVPKEVFRALAQSGEQEMAGSEVSGIDPLSENLVAGFPTDAWRTKRQRNFSRLILRLGEPDGVRLLMPRSAGSCPFSAVLVFAEPAQREFMRRFLIQRSVYPAVLWPLERALVPLPQASVELSRRILSVHCDGRYDQDDIDHIADLILDGLAQSA